MISQLLYRTAARGLPRRCGIQHGHSWLPIPERSVLDRVQLELVQRLIDINQQRHDETYEHAERVGRVSAAIATALGMDGHFIAQIEIAARLHDIGKIAIPDGILFKSTYLSPEEWVIMRTHPVIGAKILSDTPTPILQMAATIARHHHERWDGSGYPDQLIGNQIPLSARIVAVADVFDALTNRRPYKDAWPVEAAIQAICQAAATQFDPTVVHAFLQISDIVQPT